MVASRSSQKRRERAFASGSFPALRMDVIANTIVDAHAGDGVAEYDRAIRRVSPPTKKAYIAARIYFDRCQTCDAEVPQVACMRLRTTTMPERISATQRV